MFNTELNLHWQSLHTWLRDNGPKSKDMCPWIPLFYKKTFPDDVEWDVKKSILAMPIWDYEQFGDIGTVLTPQGAQLEWCEYFSDHGGETAQSEEQKQWAWTMPAEILRSFLRIIYLLEEEMT